MIDLFALAVVALVVFFPSPTINAYPALQADRTNLDRVALLQDAVYRRPDDAAAAAELARAYLDVEQPAFALGTLHPFLRGGDYRAHQVAAYAYATVLMPREAQAEAEAGLAACDAAPGTCPETTRIRLGYLQQMMKKLVDAGIDPKHDPSRARRLVAESLHATKGLAPADGR